MGDIDRRAFLETIGEEADQLDKTISDLLTLNRVESGSVKPNLRTESVAQIAEDALESKSVLLKDRDIIVDLPDLMVSTDSSLIRQAIANLVENAALHSRPGGSIRVNAMRIGQQIELAVEDEGPGVEEEELPFIFNPYYRARNSKAAPNGSGLGLAIVQGFVLLCGGNVRAESQPQHTRFVIALPAAPVQAEGFRP